MRLIQMLAVVLTQFSVGTLLLAGLLPPREIRRGFFALNSVLGALAAAVALLLIKFGAGGGWWDVRYLGLTVIAATAAYGSFRLDKPDVGRLFLIAAGFLGLVFGLLPLSRKTLLFHDMTTSAAWLFDASVVSGALLLGATNVGMTLGHWYLLMRRLSFVHLERFAQLLLGAVGLRLLIVGGILTGLPALDPELARHFLPPLWSLEDNLFFLVLRLVLGLAVPGVLGVMVLQCVRRQANQAATGLLYIAEVSVIFGELFAAYLLI